MGIFILGGLEMVNVGRYIHGVTLNPREYLLDNDGEVMEFETEKAAKTFLKEKGFMEDDLEGLVFEMSKYLKAGSYTPEKDGEN
jgi:hypothetical protein